MWPVHAACESLVTAASDVGPMGRIAFPLLLSAAGSFGVGRALQGSVVLSVRFASSLKGLPFVMAQGRFSFVGAQPALEVVAKDQTVTVLDHVHGERSVQQEADPMQASTPWPCQPISLNREGTNTPHSPSQTTFECTCRA